MKLKCTASIGGMYWKSNEKSAEGMKQKRGAATMDGLAAGDDPGTGKHTCYYQWTRLSSDWSCLSCMQNLV